MVIARLREKLRIAIATHAHRYAAPYIQPSLVLSERSEHDIRGNSRGKEHANKIEAFHCVRCYRRRARFSLIPEVYFLEVSIAAAALI
jgi:hypothetical protein